MPALLLPHIVSIFPAHRENVATLSIEHILSRDGVPNQLSDIARRVIGALIHDFTGRHIAIDGISRQKAAGGGVPDIHLKAGVHDVGFIEVKLSAGLTDRQPIDYLNNLPKDGLLIFLVPRWREGPVWRELKRRCESARLEFSEQPNLRSLKIGDKSLISITWEDLLTRIENALETTNDPRLSDVSQLRSLCEVERREAFVPIPPEQSSAIDIPRWIIGCYAVTEELARRLEKDGITYQHASHGMKAEERRQPKWFCYQGIGFDQPYGTVWVGLWWTLWRDFGASPLWFWVAPVHDGDLKNLEQKLRDRKFAIEVVDGGACVPLFLAQPDCDFDQFVEKTYRDVKAILEALK